MTAAADAPAPFTPPDCDLRDFAFMPLDVLRLRDSGAAALPNPEAFRACVLAWCASWHQVPAASLPDDDAALSVLLGYGRTVAAWSKVRKAGGLHGWVKCSDGRLYHPVVAEKAREAWDKKQAQRERSRKGNDARWKEGKDRKKASQGEAETVPEGQPGDPAGTDTASQKDEKTVPNRPKGQGQVQGEEDFPCDPPLADDAPPKASPPRKAADQGTRLPDDWQPGPEEVAFATSLGLDPKRVAARFRDFWHGKPGKEGRKSNWLGTWRNWCRTDAEDPRNIAVPPPRQPGVSYAGTL